MNISSVAALPTNPAVAEPAAPLPWVQAGPVIFLLSAGLWAGLWQLATRLF